MIRREKFKLAYKLHSILWVKTETAECFLVKRQKLWRQTQKYVTAMLPFELNPQGQRKRAGSQNTSIEQKDLRKWGTSLKVTPAGPPAAEACLASTVWSFIRYACSSSATTSASRWTGCNIQWGVSSVAKPAQFEASSSTSNCSSSAPTFMLCWTGCNAETKLITAKTSSV